MGENGTEWVGEYCDVNYFGDCAPGIKGATCWYQVPDILTCSPGTSLLLARLERDYRR